MPNSIVFSNPGASIIRWGDGVAAPYLTLSVNGSTALVGAAVTGTVTNTGSAAGQWSVASAPADVLVSPSSGTLAVNAFASFTLTALAAGAKVITLSSSTPGATIVGSPASLTVTSIAPPPPPPAPIAPSAAYRNGQAYLFNSIVAAVEPSRIVGGSDLNLNTVGPMRDYVDVVHGGGWAWGAAGGDWIDATLTRQGSAHWATMSTPAAGAVTTTYSTSVTTALQRVRSAGRWNAWIVSRGTGGSVRTIAGRFNATTSYRPRIEVVYTDATTATLNCRVSAFTGSGLNAPDQAAATYSMSTANNTGEIALEFDLPTKDIASATLYFTVTNHWGASCNINFNLADPPLNTDPVTRGYADAYPLDVGIAGHASTIFSHRYNSGSVLADYHYTATTVETELATGWDPALTGGASDTSKLPHVGQGKWVGTFGAGTTVVSDSYTGEGFTPLATGMGALKVVMDKAVGITDGFEGGQSGTGAANAHLYLPLSKIGARNLFVRYYLRIGNTADTNGAGAYRATLAQKYNVLKLGVPTWTDMAGKCSIGFAHKTKFGGNSGTAGGGYGWTLRQEFADYVESTSSPSAGGWARSWSWTDYQNNPTGHNYGGVDLPSGVTLDAAFHGLAQRGGLGSVLYADRWYCIEEEIYLNSVNVSSGTGDGRNWTPDGRVRCWVDGRLAYEQSGVVLRSLPAIAPDPSYQPPVADLGVLSMWFNWFHGGLTQNSINRVAFVSGLVVGEARIGPMSIPSTIPSWVPAAGELATLTVANGKLANNWRDAVPAHYQTYYSTEVVNAYGGAVKNPHWGTLGATMWFGSGHASGTNDNGVYLAEYGASQITFKCISQGTNWALSGGQNDGANPIIDSLVAFPWLESTIDGKPLSPHIWKTSFIQGPADGGGTYGTFWQALMPAVGHKGFNARAAYKLPINSMTADTATWARGSAATAGGASSSFLGTIGGASAPVCTAYVPSQQRCYMFYNSGGNTANLEWLDLTTGAYVTGTGTTLEMDLSDGGSDSSATTFPVPQRNLVVMCYRKAGVLAIQYLNTALSQPTAVTATLSDAALPLLSIWSCATWCSHNSRIIVAGVTGNSDAMYEITIPDTLTDPWTVTRAALGGGQTFVPIDVTAGSASSFGKFEYDEKVRAIVYLGKAERSSPDSVFVYRPRNT